MTEYETANGLDFEALRRAVDLRDPETMLGFYADDALLRVLNGDAARCQPFELRGRAEISRYLRAVFDRDVSHQVVGDWVSDEEQVTFSEACEYPDGTRVVVKTTLELREGEIVRQVDVVTRGAQETGEGGAMDNDCK